MNHITITKALKFIERMLALIGIIAFVFPIDNAFQQIRNSIISAVAFLLSCLAPIIGNHNENCAPEQSNENQSNNSLKEINENQSNSTAQKNGEKRGKKKKVNVLQFIAFVLIVLSIIKFAKGIVSMAQNPPPTASQPVVASSSEIDTSTTTAPPETSTKSNTVEPPETSTTTLPSESKEINLNGKHISGYLRKDDASLTISYRPSTTGDHRFEFSTPHVSNQYRVVLLDDTGREVASGGSYSSGMTVYLKEKETYQVCVTVSKFSEPFSFDIAIREPDN